jgi:hypothetical protein
MDKQDASLSYLYVVISRSHTHTFYSSVCSSSPTHNTTIVDSDVGEAIDDEEDDDSVNVSLELLWKVLVWSLKLSRESLHEKWPWACFLAEGGSKKVYKVYNADSNEEEAMSVMYVVQMAIASYPWRAHSPASLHCAGIRMEWITTLFQMSF